jgi:type IV pilus assembly protein PilC
MSIFQYKARSTEGKIQSGLVEAPNQSTAARLLHDKQLFVVELREKSESLAFGGIKNSFNKISFTDIVNFTRQLSTMVTAGLSLPESLTILRNQTANEVFQTMLQEVEHQIVGGGTLADSLAKYPNLFPATYIALVRAGESSGTLDLVMNRLANIMENQREFKSKVSGAMIYPIIIIVGMTIVTFIMMTVVVPKLTDLYKDFNIDLPTSKNSYECLRVFVRFWWLMLIRGFGAAEAFRRWRKTPERKLVVDTITLKIPLFEGIAKKIILVEFTRTLGMLIASGIHILEGLRILKESLGNVLFRNAITEISKKVEKGFPLGETFASYPCFHLSFLK